jgi:signal transduction histidine kinase
VKVLSHVSEATRGCARRRRSEERFHLILEEDLEIVLADDAPETAVEYLRTVIQRYWPQIREYAFDILVVLGAIGGVFEVLATRHNADGPHGSLFVMIPGVLVMTLPLLARRRYPFGAPAFVLAAGIAISFINSSFIPNSFFAFLTILAAAFLFAMQQNRLAFAGLAFGAAAIAIVVHNDPKSSPGDYIFVSVVYTTVWMAGIALGRKLSQAEQAQQEVERLQQEREQKAREAVAEERARIARELHDVVGHSVSVMTVQASAVRRRLQPDQEQEREALEIVEQTGREALAEMRRLVGVLRRPEEAPALAPQPSLEHLDRLVSQARESGLPVDLRIEGEAEQLPPGVDLTAYRLVQEGLTNAIKHAQATRADVVVRYGEGEVEISVTDDGDGGGDGGGGGHGLVGMRERVAVYGGELEAGPRPEGGYALRARLPVQG